MSSPSRKRARKDGNEEAEDTSPAPTSPTATSYFVVTHSHSYNDHTYGEVQTTHYASFPDLLKFVRACVIPDRKGVRRGDDNDGEEDEGDSEEELQQRFSDARG
eukprot:TRINITY_DN1255_c0_g1_i2.p1 TRINITY_DN1255_c0_g1~~TRINITY_DN1255_c0_g1_i2.p1  ORF type:complete len:104 (+),score=28.67 TRINITY_DN1255_c0_g1_i2:1-312(+)